MKFDHSENQLAAAQFAIIRKPGGVFSMIKRTRCSVVHLDVN